MSDEKNATWGKSTPPQSEPVSGAEAASASLEQGTEGQVAPGPNDGNSPTETTSSIGGDYGEGDGRDQPLNPTPADSDAVTRTPRVQGDAHRFRDQDVLPEILGRQLRAAYGELLSTPLPDSITSLVKALERREAAPQEQAKKQRSGKESR